MSKKGTSTFIIQRASAVVIAPLAIWVLIGSLTHLNAGYDAALAWAGKPPNALLFGVFLILGAWHMRIGMAEIIVDYVHAWTKDVLLVVNWLVSLGVIFAAARAVFKILFAG